MVTFTHSGFDCGSPVQASAIPFKPKPCSLWQAKNDMANQIQRRLQLPSHLWCSLKWVNHPELTNMEQLSNNQPEQTHGKTNQKATSGERHLIQQHSPCPSCTIHHARGDVSRGVDDQVNAVVREVLALRSKCNKLPTRQLGF